MKIIINNVCFIERKDIEHFGIPFKLLLKLGKEMYKVENYDFIKIESTELIKYFNSLSILDYGSVKGYSNEDLVKCFKMLEEECNKYASMCYSLRNINLEKEAYKKYDGKLQELNYVLNDLKKYMEHKEEIESFIDSMKYDKGLTLKKNLEIDYL